MSLKGEVGGHALNSQRNYIVDHGKSSKNHGNVFLNICRYPDKVEFIDYWCSVSSTINETRLWTSNICSWCGLEQNSSES